MPSNPLRKLSAVIALVLVLCAGTSFAEDKQAKPNTSTNFDGLAEPTEIHAAGVRISISPPKTFHLIDRQGPNTHMFVWQGAGRPNGSCPSFMLSVMAAPPGEQMPTLEQAINAVLAGIKTQRINWQQNKFESFKLNGLDFGRIYWDSLDKERRVPIRGCQYATIKGKYIFLFASQDVVPLDKETLSLCEHSIESFKILSE